MKPEQRLTELTSYVESLAGVKRKGTADRPAWYVDNRLVARAESPQWWVIRCEFAARERLLDQFPDTFEVTPAIDGHEKILASIDEGDQDAIQQALRQAWQLQRRRAF